MEDEDSD